MDHARVQGFEVYMLYVALSDFSLNLERVTDRLVPEAIPRLPNNCSGYTRPALQIFPARFARLTI
jgi:hypothetical protein